MTKEYIADATFADGHWQASVRDLPGAHTYARTLETVRKRLREVIVLMDDHPDADLHNEDAFTVGLAIEVHVTDSAGTTDSVSVAVSPATVAARGAVSKPPVANGGLTLRGGGALLRKSTTGAIQLMAAGSLAHGTTTKPSGTIELHGAGTLSGGMLPAVTSQATGTSSPPHEVVAAARTLRERAEAAEAEADHATRIAILFALDAGMGMRDIATILGISYQRVSQIAAEVDDSMSVTRRRRGNIRARP